MEQHLPDRAPGPGALAALLVTFLWMTPALGMLVCIGEFFVDPLGIAPEHLEEKAETQAV